MQKFLTVLGAATLIAATVQMAAASEHHARKARATASEQFRNSNAYDAPAYFAAQPDLSHYSAGISAPAGR
jgi:hypothetical protein